MSKPVHPVDELLAISAATPDEFDDKETTGVYDLSFFKGLDKEPKREVTALEHLADAQVGLSLFTDQAGKALERGGLTVDQRIHVATILSYIEALAKRLEIVRTPGFVQRKKR